MPAPAIFQTADKQIIVVIVMFYQIKLLAVMKKIDKLSDCKGFP